MDLDGFDFVCHTTEKDPLPTPCARHNWTPWRGQGQLWSTMGTCSKISHGLLIGLESGHYRDHVDTLSSLSGPVVAECSVGSLPSTCRRRNLLGKLGLQVVGFEYQVAPSKEMITEMCFSYNFFINSIFFLKVRMGIEPMIFGLQDQCLATWPPCLAFVAS